MSGKNKRGLRWTKLLSILSGGPGPPAQSIQQANTPPTTGPGPQPMLGSLESSSAPPAAPTPNVELHDNTWNSLPASIPPAPPTTQQSAKRERWAGLKALVNVFSRGFNNFGPLKQAVDGIVAGIDIFETAAQNRVDYENLRNDLNALFNDLAEFFKATTPPVMAPSITNFAKEIDRELETVRLKLSETSIGTHLADAEKILEHYRRIESLLQRIAMNINIKAWQTINEQATENRLKSLPNSSAAKYDSAESSGLLRGRCTQDTRTQVLEDLYEWACDDKSQKIYWLNGMAGTGKTTIAYSLCERLKASESLAASFFCSRQLPACRNVNWIVPTISYQLSRFSLPFRNVISQVLEKDSDAHNHPLLDQFKKLVAETLVQVKDVFPANLVVVIDALDECDDNDGVDQMLAALLSHVKVLPIKFFVASRPGAKILDRMRSQHGNDLSTELRLHELGRSIVQEDIKRYLMASLSRPRVNLSSGDFDTLVERSGVLFIYASTVVRYIGYDNFSRAGSRLKQVLNLTKYSASNSEKDINTLYTTILEAALYDSNLTSEEQNEMMLVLHTVVCAQEPLSVDAMASLLGLDAEAVWAALRPLFSVLHVLDATQIVTTLHESFPDYLFNRDRSGAFHCNVRGHNRQLAQLCFEQIKLPNPPFNICNLASSYVLDEDVPDLPARVEKAISKQLLYACRYWVYHYMLAEESQNLVNMLREFASERFLLWMEVMSLSKMSWHGLSALKSMQIPSLSTSYLDESMSRFVQDMSEFADSFASSLGAGRSTPHIYVSTLTFWPNHTPISDHYGQQQIRLITERGTTVSLTKPTPVATPNVQGEIRCVSYSPDGAYIASGRLDSTIRIWDAHTGQPMGQSLLGHTGPIRSVAYSPDGAYVVSGSKDKTVRIWDAHTGQPVGQPLDGHTDWVNSVAYSPDGAYIVSGSLDRTIRIWSAYTGQPVGQSLQGHTCSVLSIAYSPDGAYIVSGSLDKTIRIWDAHTGQPVGQPLIGHTSVVCAVAYSPDGAYIVSGSYDMTIQIWDVYTGQPVGQPLEGHSSIVRSVAYSPDGAYIVSGSWDKTIRIWDARTCQPAGQPLLGHMDYLWSVACSPAGAYILSGSADGTIRVWDMNLALLTDDGSEINDGQPQLVRSLRAIPESRILCTLGCQINCPHVAWTLNKDGWIVFNDDRLICVPDYLQKALLVPKNTALMSPGGVLQLDLDRNKLGKHWKKYFRPGKFIEQ